MSNAPRAVKGMHDLLPAETRATAALEAAFREHMERACFGELRTPMLEHLQLFVRSVGEGTDIVDKELFHFAYHGDELALRPEGTASAVRAYLEHKLHNHEPITRVWYAGPMFRGERPQKGRYRQFAQLGAEVFGDEGPQLDAEVIDLLVGFLRSIGIQDARVLLGSLGGAETRARYREALVAYLTPRQDQLGPESQRRLELNPLRILDSKRPEDQKVVEGAPRLAEFLGDDDRAHFDGLRRALDALGTPYEIDDRLVRGLDYYSRTLFEIKGATDLLGAGDTLAGGGRYDRLVASWGGPDVPAFGFAAGLERLRIAQRTAAPAPRASVFLVPMGERARTEVMLLTRELRHLGVAALTDAREGRSVKSLMKRADAHGAALAVLIGEQELDRGVVAVKVLQAETPTQFELTRAEAAAGIAAHLATGGAP